MKISLLCATLLLVLPLSYCQKTPILFQHVRVFDGNQVIPDTDVLIEKGLIKEVGANLSAEKAKVIDGMGKTLLPGLIDAHVHVFGADALEQALIFGVTTEFDMMMQPRLEHRLKTEESDRRASFFSAGSPATVPGGHGTEYGFEIPTITRAKDAQSFVDARLREGSDYIKIMYTAGVSFGPRGERPTLSKETLAAVIAAAHERRRLAVVHIGSVEGARDAIEAGADGLAHIFHGPSSPRDFGQFVAAHHAFVIPTLSVLHSVCGPDSAGKRLLSDPNLAPYLSHEDISRLKETFPSASSGRISCKGSTQAISQLQAAGVPIVAGTDAPNPGTTYGASLHGELELYVEAGLTPTQALTTATSAPAAAFHVPDRGRIAPGLRADLLLVNGHPDEDIKATRNIVAVYKGGNEVDRKGYYHGK
ncbi:MAG TPA: amidohydrolase family protein [Candidatus Angelobacter sp.]|nr:amidohydrolase family protein [Candidatus Angelobacter sp.]